ncbi:MAG: cobalt transporter [Eubacterium sp.]|nr:cobalt transporter [Eubacterium sp.]
MKCYILDAESQTMKKIPSEKTGVVLQEGQVGIKIMTREELKKSKISLSYKNNLLYSLEYIKYSKVEIYRGSIQGIVRIPKIASDCEEEFVFGFHWKENNLWLISDNKELVERVNKIKEDIYQGFTLPDFVLALFNNLIEEDALELQNIEDELEQIEERLLKRKPEHFNEIIMQYRRQLSKIHAGYVQLNNIGDCLQAARREQFPEESEGWGLFTHRVERLHDYVETLREYVQQLRELYQTQIDVEQNRIVTVLTVVTTLFLPLSLIAAWYGMNFPNMPELHWRYGYLLIIVISAVIIIAELIFFKKKKIWK